MRCETCKFEMESGTEAAKHAKAGHEVWAEVLAADLMAGLIGSPSGSVLHGRFERIADKAEVEVDGVGPDEYKAWVDAAERARVALCPKSATPGYDMKLVAWRYGDEEWREAA